MVVQEKVKVAVAIFFVALLFQPMARAHGKTHASCQANKLVRHERKIDGGDPGVKLFLMHIKAPAERRGAVVMMHGAGSGSTASFDLRHGDYSMMRALACAGFDTYAIDARGYGGSTMPKEMLDATEKNPPAVRATDVIRDLDSAVRFATKTSSVAKVDVIGWSWGSEVSGWYTSKQGERVRRLVLIAPIYDRRWPKRHQTKNAWTEQRRSDLEKLFDPAREERAIWDEVVASLYRFTNGDVMRLPNGPYRDIYGEDAPLWSPKTITAPTLIVRGDQDKASLDVHALKLFTDLEKAESRRYVVIGGAGHFPFREHRHRELFSVVTGFLEEKL